MAYIRQYHKDTDTTYVYESESYWDPEKKQARSRRKVIGKIDPQTGDLIPTGKRGRKKKEADMEGTADLQKISLLYEDTKRTIQQQELTIASQKEEIRILKEKLSETEKQNRSMIQALKKIGTIMENLSV